MKLLFYDKFFDSFINLPKTIQKKVVTFQKKFKEDSRSAAIHLEPISTFRDPSLRSARIDQTYRAIIKAPDDGNIFYLLWVDHHDNAYDWASNKLFQWNMETQSMQMFTAPEVEMEEQENKSFDDYPEFFFDRFEREQLLNIGVPEILLPTVRKIDSYDDLDAAEEYIPKDTFENLFYLLDGANIDLLIHEVQEGKVKEEDLEAQVISINNQRSFIELTDDELFNVVLSGTLDKWKYYLHPSQRKLVTGNFNSSVKVTGGAGTGKTVAALHRLKYLSENKANGEKILFTTFTKALTGNLRRLAEGLGVNMDQVTLTHIDEIVFGHVHEYGLLPDGFKVIGISSTKEGINIWEDIMTSELSSFSPEFLEKEYLEVLLYHDVTSLKDYYRTSRVGRGKAIGRRQRKEIWGYVTKFDKIKEDLKLYYKEELYNLLYKYLLKHEVELFDYCLVDELQDFSNVELRVIRSLVPEKQNDLFLVGDPMQKVYDKKINFSRVNINIRGKRSRRLRINYRTTEEIKKLAVSVIRDFHYDNFDGEQESTAGYVSLYHGKKPTYKLFRTKDEEINYVLDQVKDLIAGGYRYEEIALCARSKDALKDFRNALHQQDLRYSFNTIPDPDSDQISLLTFHKVKGLEFKVVFIVDVDKRSIPYLPYDFADMSTEWQENYMRNERSLMYVAISRAIENVFISGVGQESEVIQL